MSRAASGLVDAPTHLATPPAAHRSPYNFCSHRGHSERVSRVHPLANNPNAPYASIPTGMRAKAISTRKTNPATTAPTASTPREPTPPRSVSP